MSQPLSLHDIPKRNLFFFGTVRQNIRVCWPVIPSQQHTEIRLANSAAPRPRPDRAGGLTSNEVLTLPFLTIGCLCLALAGHQQAAEFILPKAALQGPAQLARTTGGWEQIAGSSIAGEIIDQQTALLRVHDTPRGRQELGSLDEAVTEEVAKPCLEHVYLAFGNGLAQS